MQEHEEKKGRKRWEAKGGRGVNKYGVGFEEGGGSLLGFLRLLRPADKEGSEKTEKHGTFVNNNQAVLG